MSKWFNQTSPFAKWSSNYTERDTSGLMRSSHHYARTRFSKQLGEKKKIQHVGGDTGQMLIANAFHVCNERIKQVCYLVSTHTHGLKDSTNSPWIHSAYLNLLQSKHKNTAETVKYPIMIDFLLAANRATLPILRFNQIQKLHSDRTTLEPLGSQRLFPLWQ